MKSSILKMNFCTILGVIFWGKVNEHVTFLRVNGKQQTDCWWYKYCIPSFFNAVEECGKAIRLLNTKVGGKVMTLSPGSMAFYGL